jgi:outer membrane protein OmpA-like peptidoglycan-associated protein
MDDSAFENLRKTIDESIDLVRGIPRVATDNFSTEDLKDEVIPMLERAKYAIFKSKKRFDQLEKLSREIDTIRDEIIEPVTSTIRKSSNLNSWFSILSLTIGVLGALLAIGSFSKESPDVAAFGDAFYEFFNRYRPQGYQLVPVPKKPSTPVAFDDLLFENGTSSRLLPASEHELHRLLTIMYFRPEMTIQIIGHADKRGSDRFNKKLAIERSHYVSNFLESNGITRERIEVRALGSADPRVSGNSEIGRQLDRRVEIKVVKPPNLQPAEGDGRNRSEDDGRN